MRPSYNVTGISLDAGDQLTLSGMPLSIGPWSVSIWGALFMHRQRRQRHAAVVASALDCAPDADD